MKPVRRHKWGLRPKQAIALQTRLAKEVVLEDTFSDPQYVAGVDVGFEKQGKIARAAVVILDVETLSLVQYAVAILAVTMPYIPGLLSFREIPVVLKAFNKIDIRPDILLCDGQGIAHPRRFGIASHLGLLMDVASIGVGKTRLLGTHSKIPDKKGAWRSLMCGDEKVGVVIRTRTGVKPLYISPGHKISIDTSIDIVMQCITRYRLPETTRNAHKLASG